MNAQNPKIPVNGPTQAAEEFVQAAEREKQQMQQLNSRLEAYLNRVRQLENRNKELVVELDTLRGSLGTDIGQIK
uniref:IF rod domain-containing protein n=1 Tax=Caenorhabditis japonica TaxID=281687 RepID=A0A8R1IIQ8_CAEJA